MFNLLQLIGAETRSQTTCSDRDPRRIQPIVDFIFSLKIDFQSESVFPCKRPRIIILQLSS